jgi:hypothetical protein
MTSPAIDKAAGRVEHLLDSVIELRHKLALLHPLLPLEPVSRATPQGPASKALAVLRFALFGSCLQDLVKATLDQDPRAPSVAKIAPLLEDQFMYAELRKRFCDTYFAGAGANADVRAVLEALSLEEGGEPGQQFDQVVQRFRSDWAHLSQTPRMLACKTVRDKLLAHTELHFVHGSYRLLDVTPLGLQWTDLGPLTAQLQDCTTSLNLLIRSAGFDFEGLDRQLAAMSSAFWPERA